MFGVSIIFLFMSIAEASFSGCGEYFAKGYIRILSDNKLTFVANEGTLSEYRLFIPSNAIHKSALLINRPVTGVLKISKPLNGREGDLLSISDLSIRIADPLSNFRDGELTLKKGEACH